MPPVNSKLWPNEMLADMISSSGEAASALHSTRGLRLRGAQIEAVSTYLAASTEKAGRTK